MRYLIMGTGALGSVFAGLLQHAGQTVAGLGRGEHFHHLSTRGLTITGIWGNFHLGPLAKASSAATYDVILLCVKSFDTEAACRQLRGRLAPEGLMVSVQNGLGNLEIIARHFGSERTIGARVIFGAQVNRPGLVSVTVYADQVLLGAFGPGASREKMAQLVADLNRAGIPAAAVDDILPHLWGKVLYNCALNPLGAILAAPYGDLGGNAATRELMRRVIGEIYQVARAKGVRLPQADAASYFQYFLERLVPPTAAHWPSMWQDLQAGRRTEIEALNGTICRYGKTLGIPTPYNDALRRLVRFLEARAARQVDEVVRSP